MRAFLEWSDGTREQTELAGGHTIVVHRRVDQRFIRSVFRLDEETACGCPTSVWRYVESYCEDASEDLARATETNRKQTWDFLRRGWGLPS